MTFRKVIPGSVSFWRNCERVIVMPGDIGYEQCTLIATDRWSARLDCWVDINIHSDLPSFLSMRGSFAHLNSDCNPFGWGVTLDGVPQLKWETASLDGYVDVWQRDEPASAKYGVLMTMLMVRRHRLFGEVRFVAL